MCNKIKTIITIILLTALSHSNLYAQDIIFKDDKTTIKCKLIKVGTEEIEYKQLDNLEGPIFTINQSDVVAVYYDTPSAKNYDIIYKTDKTSIKVLISKISSDEVEFKKFDNPDGPINTLNLSDVSVVKYKNGTFDFFTVPSRPSYYSEPNAPIQNNNTTEIKPTNTNATIEKTEAFTAYFAAEGSSVSLGILNEYRFNNSIVGAYGQFQGCWATNDGTILDGSTNSLYYMGFGLSLGTKDLWDGFTLHAGVNYEFNSASVIEDLKIVNYSKHFMGAFKLIFIQEDVNPNSPFLELMIGYRF